MENKRFNIYDEYNADVKFFKLPKVFFTNELYSGLSNNAKISWSIMRDRLAISQKNKWFDENGDIYFIYTQEKLSKILNLSERSVQRIKAELRGCNLLEIKKQGLSKPDILYLNYPVVTKEDIYRIDSMENSEESAENYLQAVDKRLKAKEVAQIRYGNFKENDEKSCRHDKLSHLHKSPSNQHSYRHDKLSHLHKSPSNQHSYRHDNLSLQDTTNCPPSKNYTNNLETIDSIEANQATKTLDNIALSVFYKNHESSYLNPQQLSKIFLIANRDINSAETLLKGFNIAKRKVEQEIGRGVNINLYGEDDSTNEIIENMLDQYIFRKRRNEIKNEGAYSYTLFREAVINIALNNITKEKREGKITEYKFREISDKLYEFSGLAEKLI